MVMVLILMMMSVIQNGVRLSRDDSEWRPC